MASTFALLTPSTPVHAQAAMTHEGSFSVSPNGAAVYSVPLRLLPGIAGVQPNLALAFNSQSGNGHVGVGWSLTGLSAITRCGQTWVQDNLQTAVNYTGSDRFCLDGKRLIQRKSSASDTTAYGDNNTLYHTEFDSLTRVLVATEAGIVGPKSFTATSRDGLTYEYGGTADSRIQVVGAAQTTNRAWALNKVTDRFGNYYTVEYTKDSPSGVFNGGFYPKKISYTGNARGATAVLPQVFVEFSYSFDRIDSTVTYQAGYSITERGRLNAITASTSAGVVHRYDLSYQDSLTGRSRLTSIRMCDAAKTTCLPAIEPIYDGLTSTSLDVVKRTAAADPKLLNHGLPSASYLIKDGAEWVVGDFQGNGLVDLAHLTVDASDTQKGRMMLWKSNGAGDFTIAAASFDMFQSWIDNTGKTTKYTNHYYRGLSGADVNWDGVPDLIVEGAQHAVEAVNPGFARACKYQAQISYFVLSGGFFSSGKSISTPYTNPTCDGAAIAQQQPMFILGDMAGIGRYGQSTVRKSIGEEILVHVPVLSLGGGEKRQVDDQGNTGRWFNIDLNRDGISDIVHMLDASYFVWMNSGKKNASGYQFAVTKYTSYAGLLAGRVEQLDVNADGLADFAHIPASGSSINLWISKGNGTFDVKTLSNATDTFGVGVGSWQVLDYNGDGYQDLIHLADATNGRAQVWLSNGRGGVSGVTLDGAAFSDKNLTVGRWKSGAFRGDGTVDLVHFLDDSGNYAVWNMPRWAGDIPAGIKNGAYSVKFKQSHFAPMLGADATKGGKYTMAARTINANHGLTTTIPSFKVVTEVEQDDGIGGGRKLGYNYENAQIQPGARGFLGFEFMETIDLDTNFVSRVKYKQAFPFIGMVDSVETKKSRADTTRLSLTTNTYGCFAPTDNYSVTFNTSAQCAGDVTSFYVGDGAKRYFPYLQQKEQKTWDLNGAVMPPMKEVYSAFNVYGTPTKIEQFILSNDGFASVTDYKRTTDLTYYNSEADWAFDRLLKKEITASGPDVPGMVSPGSGGLPAAPAPTLTYLPPSWLSVINLLLDN